MTSRGRVAWTAALLLASAQSVLLVRTARDKSDTVDEPTYLENAARQWVYGDFVSNCESPALPKWGFALALRLADPGLFVSEGPGEWSLPHPLWSRDMAEIERNLLAARMATIFVTVVAGLLLWSTARRFGDGAAAVTHALWCFSPTVLAQGSLATLDAWAAGSASLALWSVARFIDAPGRARAAVVGLALALAAACKATALGMLPVVGAVFVWARIRRTPGAWRGPLLRDVIVGAAAACATLWTVYAFTVGPIGVERGCRIRPGEATFGPVPFPMYIKAVYNQWQHGQRGHVNYLFGQVGASGWWWFYLAALALKTTLGAQALTVLRLASWGKRPPRRSAMALDAALLAYPALLLVVLSLGRTQNGIKYLLPAFPFAMLWAGRGLADAQAAFGRLGTAGVWTCVVGGAAASLLVHPHHLMFFNTWAGGPRGGPRYFIHGDDWGQDQKRLGEWQEEHRIKRLFYTEYGGNPSAWGIASRNPPCDKPRTGVFALHAVEVHRPKRRPAGCLDWLTVEPPDERIGYSIYIYRVDEARLERLQKERLTEKPFWRSGPSPAAARPSLEGQ